MRCIFSNFINQCFKYTRLIVHLEKISGCLGENRKCDDFINNVFLQAHILKNGFCFITYGKFCTLSTSDITERTGDNG